MNERNVRLIHLSHCRGIGTKALTLFYEFDPTFATIFNMSLPQLTDTFPLPKKQANLFYEDMHKLRIEELLNEYEHENIQLLTIFDDEYPERLQHIYDPPWLLFCKGDVSLLNEERQLAIVGTRTASAYGHRSLQKLLPPLIEAGWTIVSGLAKGIDTFSHQITMQLRGQTIAVLGSGFYNVYPAQNRALASQLFKEQLVISEYPPSLPPQKWMFPRRNRIISGLSKGTLVVEAKQTSGSFITADFALEQGREVFAVPGCIFDERSIGTNRLIQMGAKLVMSATDILDEFR